jgi:hypothetical protein
MIRSAVFLALSTLCVALGGCAREWSRLGTTEQQLNADKLTCEQDAARLYPVIHDAPVSYRPTAPSKLDTSCVQQSGFNNCDTAGGAGTPASAVNRDANGYDRDAAVKSCLVSKGYTYKKTAH